MIFSIIVVCLNAGEKLRETVDSILAQTEQDYEIILKDGGSTDETTRKYLEQYEKMCGSEETGREEGLAGEGEGTDGGVSGRTPKSRQKIRVYRTKDRGIYDGMNQAVRYVCGDFVLFLNCGDSFYDDRVLEQVRDGMTRMKMISRSRVICYGNIYEQKTGTLVQSNPVIDDFACYRNVPCHQACFYGAELLRERGFDTGYIVRADYEHFVWCYYRARAVTVYLPVTVASYEGGGFSETRENAKRSAREHREIVNRYMPAAKVLKYRLLMIVTLAPVRRRIAESPVTAGVYQKIKSVLYGGRLTRDKNNRAT